jgi:hypothetical protein
VDEVSSPCGNERDAAHRNGVIMRLRNKVGADVRLVYIYLERQGVVLQNTRPNRISVGGVWNGRSGDPVSRSGVHYLIWILPPAHFYPQSSDFPFSPPSSFFISSQYSSATSRGHQVKHSHSSIPPDCFSGSLFGRKAHLGAEKLTESRSAASCK